MSKPFSDDHYATVLITQLVDEYGTEALTWTPETIRHQIQEDFGVELSQATTDRLMAGISLLTNNFFYRRLSAFIPLCNALSGSTVDPDTIDIADPWECAWAMTEALLIAPPQTPADGQYAEEIRHYIGAVCREFGIVNPPDILQVAIGGDISDLVSTDFADEPEMFEAIWNTHQQNADDISNMLSQNLQELSEQLKGLKLKNGNTSFLSSGESRAS
jgi:hypothetical protein